MTRVGSLFSGYGGLDQAVTDVMGGTVAWVSDIDPGACKILAHRYPDVPNLGDITAVDWARVEPVDVITGGFPCQDVSMAGRRKGMGPGTRSGLWSAMCRAVYELRPSLMVAENVRGLLSADGHADVEPCPWCLGDTDAEPAMRALGGVLGDLADIGYDAAWYGLTAASVGAPHGRFRVFIVAWPTGDPARFIGQRGRAVRGKPARDSRAGGGADKDPDRTARSERRQSAPGQEAGWRAWADAGGSDRAPATDATTDPEGEGLEGLRPEPARGGSERGGPTHADTYGDGRESDGRLNSVGRDLDRRDSQNSDGHTAEPATQWGQFEAAVRRWERTLGRPAPAPTETSAKGGQRLSPRFVEWMMGLPDGHVTEVPGLTRNEQLKALGNGVVPRQAAAALRILLPHTPYDV